MNTPILETKRLILRPVTVADADEIYTNWTSDPEVAKYMRWSTHPNVEVTREWLTFVEKNNATDTSYDWGFVRKSDNKLIGTGGLYYDENHQCFEIGYNIMKDCWHQGYTTEAAKAMVDFAVATLGETKFCGRHAKENPNSGKVMEKVGFCYVNDGHYESFDGTKQGETREYILEVKKTSEGADMNCIFCKIVNKEIPSMKVYEDEHTLVFMDIAKDVDGHMVAIPKKHIKNILDCDVDTLNHLMITVKKIANHCVDECNYDGVNLLNASDESAGQSVPHFHIHIIPRRHNDRIDAWPKFDGANHEIEEIFKKIKKPRY